MKYSKNIAICSIFTAMSVVLMFVGGLSFIFAYTIPMIVGVMMIIIDQSFSKKSAIITFLATSVLSLILVADKECVMIYISFFGYYPIVKCYFENISNKAVRFIVKLLFFNITMAICQLILVYVFGVPFLESGEGRYLIIVFIVLMNLLFIVHDKLIYRLTILYKIKFEKRIKNLFK